MIDDFETCFQSIRNEAFVSRYILKYGMGKYNEHLERTSSELCASSLNRDESTHVIWIWLYPDMEYYTGL